MFSNYFSLNYLNRESQDNFCLLVTSLHLLCILLPLTQSTHFLELHDDMFPLIVAYFHG
jgi:hypothetical protein